MDIKFCNLKIQGKDSNNDWDPETIDEELYDEKKSVKKSIKATTETKAIKETKAREVKDNKLNRKTNKLARKTRLGSQI